MNYSPAQLEQSEAALTRLYTALREVPAAGDRYEPTAATVKFHAAMDDDFNTPEAIAVLQGLARELNSGRAAGADPAALARTAAELRALGAVLGVLKVAPESWFRAGAAGSLADSDIEERIQARLTARKTRNWAESDRIRDELAQGGVVLEDKPGGTTTWRRA
jgi:cysteinyl-tRNA synthetase